MKEIGKLVLEYLENYDKIFTIEKITNDAKLYVLGERKDIDEATINSELFQTLVSICVEKMEEEGYFKRFVEKYLPLKYYTYFHGGENAYPVRKSEDEIIEFTKAR